MKKHWLYFRYVARHKWFVFKAGLVTGAPLWRLVIHDWSKFLPSEWFPYVEKFYGRDATRRPESIDEDFNRAWLKHQHRNPHHWQHWLLAEDNPSKRLETPQSSGEQRAFPLRMPTHFVREMVADWAGAGRAITGKWELAAWYERNKENVILHPDTQQYVELLIDILMDHRWLRGK